MILGGVILLIAGAVIALLAFLNSTNIFSDMGKLGFGPWVARFFDPQNLSAKKIFFYAAIIMMVVGFVLWMVGRIRRKKGTYRDERAERAGKYFHGLVSEAKKVVWPDRKTVVRNTLVTIAMCALLFVLIWAVDFGLSSLVTFMLSL